MRRGSCTEGEQPHADESARIGAGGTEALWRIYESINEWIRAADGKAAVILAADGVVATILAALGGTSNSSVQILTAPNVLLWLGMIAVVFSATFSAGCLFPRLRAKAPRSLIYFKDIAETCSTPEAYAVRSQQVIENDSLLAKELCNQIWSNSAVANCKFAAVRGATLALAVAVLLVFMSGLLARTL